MGFILQLSILSLAVLVVCGTRIITPPDPPCHWDEHQCPNKVCIPKSCLCDGNNDCGDNTDEKQNCPTPPVPECPFRFQCTNGTCISISKVCDRVYDCGDGFDELDCPTVPPPCPAATHFQCSGGDCIHNSKKCDGVYDCVDGADELGCPTPATKKPWNTPATSKPWNTPATRKPWNTQATRKPWNTPATKKPDPCIDISSRCAKNAHQCKTHSLVKKNCKKTCDLCEPLW